MNKKANPRNFISLKILLIITPLLPLKAYSFNPFDPNLSIQSNEVDRLHRSGSLIVRAMSAAEIELSLGDQHMQLDHGGTFKYKSTTLLPPGNGNGGGIKLFAGEPFFMVIDGERCGKYSTDPTKAIRGGIVAVYRSNGFTYGTLGRAAKQNATDIKSLDALKHLVKERSLGSPSMATTHNEVLFEGIDPSCIKGFGMREGAEAPPYPHAKALFQKICQKRGTCFPVFSYNQNANRMTDITDKISDSPLRALQGHAETILNKLRDDGHLTGSIPLKPGEKYGIFELPVSGGGHFRMYALKAAPSERSQVWMEFPGAGLAAAGATSRTQLPTSTLHALAQTLIPEDEEHLFPGYANLDSFKAAYGISGDTASFGEMANILAMVHQIRQGRTAREAQVGQACQEIAHESQSDFQPLGTAPGASGGGGRASAAACGQPRGIAPAAVSLSGQVSAALQAGICASPVDQEAMGAWFSKYTDQTQQAGAATLPDLSKGNSERFWEDIQTQGYPLSELKLNRSDIAKQTHQEFEFDPQYAASFGGNPRDLVYSGPVYLTGRGLSPAMAKQQQGKKLRAVTVSAAGANLKYEQHPVRINGKTLMMSDDREEFMPGGVFDQSKYKEFMKMKWNSILDTFRRKGVTHPILPAFGLGAFVDDGLRPRASKASAEALRDVLSEFKPPFPQVTLALIGNNDAGAAHCQAFGRVFQGNPLLNISGKSMFNLAADIALKGGVPGLVNPSDREALLTGNLGQFWHKGHVALEETFAYTTTILLSNFRLTGSRPPKGYEEFLTSLGAGPQDQLDQVISRFQEDPKWKAHIRSNPVLRALLHKFLAGENHAIGKARLAGVEREMEQLHTAIQTGDTSAIQRLTDELHRTTDLRSIQFQLSTLNPQQERAINQMPPLVRRGLVMFLGYLTSPKGSSDLQKFSYGNHSALQALAAKTSLDDIRTALSGGTLDPAFEQFLRDIRPSSMVEYHHIIPSGPAGAVGHGVAGGKGRGAY